ncbi:hypothetical protein ACT17_15340 [Mycolicibacterium conceptionense]|uniref:Uncharacterized protein n=1 Tax=Mycolicibacterium conceptionense TaxID=451644 RepID=A0A0J8WX90_9MYCO|nr:GAF domain-containing protein [Mycolicibacterium conceptionense]KMV17649.1 hypothetical protein ACT17_15340 [Mycolicibacterium conceptionense]
MTAVPQWILATTLVDPTPRVIAIGRTLYALKALTDVVRGPRRKAICAAVDAAVRDRRSVERIYAREGFRVVAEPFLSAIGVVNAVRVCAVSADSQLGTADGLPERLPTGAWVWELDRAVTMPSPELYDLYHVPPEMRRPELTAAEWMSRYTRALRTPDRVVTMIAACEDGETQLDVLPVFRFDGALRDVRVAMRVQQDGDRRWLHGVTCDVTAGDAADTPKLTLSEEIVISEMSARRGVYTAIVDVQSMLPVIWLSEPPDIVQWQPTDDPQRGPAVHPDDIGELLRFQRVVQQGPTRGHLRVRAVDGSWVLVNYSAVLMEHYRDRGVLAAVVWIDLALEDASGQR